MPIFCHRFHSNEISRFFWWNSCHSMRNYSSFKIKSAVFPDHKCLETLRILSYCNLILRPAELNFRKSFDVIAFFAYTIAFRNNFCYFFRISFNCPKSCSLYFCYESGMLVIASIISNYLQMWKKWKKIKKLRFLFAILNISDRKNPDTVCLAVPG